MIKSSNGDTPFSLTYGTEAVIPAEIGMPTYRTAAVDIVRNDDEIRLNLDLLDLLHQQPHLRDGYYDSFYGSSLLAFQSFIEVRRCPVAVDSVMTNDVSAFYNHPSMRVYSGLFMSYACIVNPRNHLLRNEYLDGCKKSVKKTESGKDESSSRGEGGKKKMSTFVNALSSIARGAQQTSEHMMENQPGATQTTSQKGTIS
ncbi:hypothetical protein Tco_1483636 [Tanacetum coccineum]